MTHPFSDVLRSLVGDRLKENESMARHTNFRVGGPARWYTDVRSCEELTTLFAAAQAHRVPVTVLGGGSNTLVADEGIPGLVLQMALRGLTFNDQHVVAEAGVLSVGLARQTSDAGRSGLTWMISLPGTVGGAVRGNAGCFGGETADFLTEVEVWSNGSFQTISKREALFGYRTSRFKTTNEVILSATFQLPRGDKEQMQQEMMQMLAKRKTSQPLYAGSAGCIFQNISFHSETEVQRLSEVCDIPVEMQHTHRISAGWVIDQLGLKGTRIGNAQISPEHGNFIINLGGATATDILSLIALVKTNTLDRFGLLLHEEVALLPSPLSSSV